MTRLAGWLFGGVLLVVSALGLGRLRMDPDVLGMLPPDLPEVAGLKAYRDGFSRQDELLILLEAPAGGVAGEDAARELAERITGAGLSGSVRWRPDWMDDGRGMAELAAYLWLNGPHGPVEDLAESLAPENAESTLQQSLEDVATAMEGVDLALRSHDPFGLFRHPSLDLLMASADAGGGGFESADGRRRLIMVRAPEEAADYRKAADWIARVREVTDGWRAGPGRGMSVGFTGEPAFAAEIGGAMERDMRGTVGITMGLIGLLFWWMQRRLVLLAGLLGVLALVFVTTLGLGGWVFGELSLMAAGFAAILIGLVVDYGVLISQEAKAGRGLLRNTGPSILWAAATTAVVFFALNRSGLPGIAQLGTLVGLGMVAGALWMLGVYVPFVAKHGAGRPVADSSACPALGRRASLVVAGLIVVACGSVLAVRGLPGITFDTSLMRPRDSASMETFERIRSGFPEWRLDATRVIVRADDDAEMLRRLDTAAARFAARPECGAVVLPLGWWPDSAAQESNRALLGRIAAQRSSLAAAADQAGFSTEGVAPGLAVMDELVALMASEKTPALPVSNTAGEVMGLSISRDADGGGTAAGTMPPPPDGGDVPLESLRSLTGDGVLLAGWDLLKPAAVPLIRKDLTDVFLPMAALMGIMLALVFRKPGPVLACVMVLLLSGLVLLAVMRVLGISWNFLNIAAAPLLLGMGIDYGIHVSLAMRREAGDVRAMWRGTGKAVVFCGVSTSIGFGSLCFASNDGMASLGAVAVIGILTAMVVSVCLLPGWLGRGLSGPSART